MIHLNQVALRVRKNIINTLHYAQSGHPGPSLSVADIMTGLFFKVMKTSPEDLRDIFILSKGHAVPCLYAVLAELGAISTSDLLTLRDLGSPLQGHPVKNTLPFIDASTGSLGQGLSVAIGYALGIRLKHQKRRVYVVIGDGECQEGQIWEAAMSAAKFQLNNLVTILDYNKLQNDGAVENIMPLEPLRNKWEAFGWNVIEIDGHDLASIIEACSTSHHNKPTMIIAHTKKGKGVSFMENSMGWHSRAINSDEHTSALNELEGQLQDVHSNSVN